MISGTPTTAGGNGRASAGQYAGVAPEAWFIIVKIVSDGAPAHDNEPAEDPFFDPALIPTGIQFVLDKASEQQLPVVILANFGSIGGPADGTSELTRLVDSQFGPDKPGRVFVTGAGDDGGADNHAAGTVSQGGSVALEIQKNEDGPLRFDLWYNDADRSDVTIQTPSGSFGPFQSPATNDASDVVQNSEFDYRHLGSAVDFYNAVNDQREIFIRIDGPTGNYTVELQGASVSDGRFRATLNPARYNNNNKFLNSVVPGHSMWHMSTARYNIAPNSYVIRTSWIDIDNIPRSINPREGDEGDLWAGSSVGPTWDGRPGIDVSAPGDRTITSYAPNSYWATFRFNLIEDGNGLYGIAGAVSQAAPVVTGIIALMLEVNPNLDAAQVKQILQETARSDAFTGQTPNPEWGYGKIDALEAVRRTDQLTPVAELQGPQIPASHRLAQNYPNPFNPATRIEFALPRTAAVRLAVYDVLGRQVALLVDRRLPAGTHEAVFEGSGLASGVYFYQIEAGDFSQVRKMTLLR
jgi:hypothetical protein